MRLFTILLFGAATPGLSQADYLEEWLKKWDNSSAYLLECAEWMPQEKYAYKPTPEEMSFQEQLIHILRNMTWLAKDYLAYENQFEGDLTREEYSRDEILTLVQQGFEYAKEAARSIQPEEMETTHEFFAGPMTTRQILALMQDHVTHHRGQLIVYLRLNNIKPPRYRGW